MYKHQAAPTSGDGQAAENGDATPNPVQESDTVSLQGDAAIQAVSAAQNGTSSQPPEVFAEIWKDGMKVGTVYTDGQAVLSNAPSGMTMGGNGAAFAYIRAEEISQQVGGEVRYVNIPALQIAQTRSQLRAAYGV